MQASLRSTQATSPPRLDPESDPLCSQITRKPQNLKRETAAHAHTHKIKSYRNLRPHVRWGLVLLHSDKQWPMRMGNGGTGRSAISSWTTLSPRTRMLIAGPSARSPRVQWSCLASSGGKSPRMTPDGRGMARVML